MMRQAGRYLPEYRAVRKTAGSFLDLCFTPKLAAEVTLQPIRRFGFDAAILFSDILVIPHALGRSVRFVEGEGPQLDPLDDPAAIAKLQADRSTTASLRRSTRRSVGSKPALPPDVTFLGFCGAPWTVATYMIAGHGTPDQAPARLFAYRHPEAFGRLIDILVDASAQYLVRQLQAGVDAVQIFDTWAGVLPPDEFQRWCIAPTQRIVDERAAADARTRGSSAFRAAPATQLTRYVEQVPVDAVGLDWMIDLDFRARRDPDAAAGAGQSRSAGAARRRRRARPRRRRDARRRFPAAHSSSISATASCRTRRSRMSSGCSARQVQAFESVT